MFAANAIYTRLKDNKAKITVKIDGWAGSAATIIAMAGEGSEIPDRNAVHDNLSHVFDGRLCVLKHKLVAKARKRS